MRAEAWQAVAQIVALVALGAGAWQYLDTRKRDWTWRKTEFLLKLADDFDHDELTRSALILLERPANLSPILKANLNTLSGADLQKIRCLDRYFDFFDRLYTFEHVTEALKAKDLTCFSGYLDVLDEDEIADFASNRGYPNALSLKKEIQEEIDKTRSEANRSLAEDA